MPFDHIKLKHAAATPKNKSIISRNGQTVASSALRVKLPTKMKNKLAARIYGTDWINKGLRSANRS